MPSMVNGGKDFASWLPNDKKLYFLLRKPVEIVLGKCAVGLADIAIGESFYLKNVSGNYMESLTKLNNGLSEAQARGTLQMQFAAVGVMAKIFMAEGSMDTAVDLINNFEHHVIELNDMHLIPNIHAYQVRQQLRVGNLNYATIWMESNSPNELLEFHILDRYCYLTKVRIYIVMDKLIEAISLLNKMEYYYETYQRPYGLMETHILMAIVLFRMQDNNWRDILNKALMDLEHYEVVRLLADEGIAVVPLLDKIDPQCSREFYRVLCRTAKAYAVLYPEYLKVPCAQDISFSVTEKEVLKLLIHGLSNDQIAQLLNVKVRTIKFHISNIYSKLGVANRAQAIKAVTDQHMI